MANAQHVQNAIYLKVQPIESNATAVRNSVFHLQCIISEKVYYLIQNHLFSPDKNMIYGAYL